jgi:hypothetical protein
VHEPKQKAAAHLKKTDNFSRQAVMEVVMMDRLIRSRPASIYDNLEKDYLYYTPIHCNFVAVFSTEMKEMPVFSSAKDEDGQHTERAARCHSCIADEYLTGQVFPVPAFDRSAMEQCFRHG